jgi:hypothetical protein
MNCEPVRRFPAGGYRDRPGSGDGQQGRLRRTGNDEDEGAAVGAARGRRGLELGTHQLTHQSASDKEAEMSVTA